MGRKKAKTSKKCRACERQRKVDHFQPHPKTEDGLRHVCRDCQKPSRNGKNGKNGKTPTDAHLNGILANLGTVLDSTMMPTLNALVRAMRASGTTRVTVDLEAGYIEIPEPTRYALPKGGK